MMRSAEYTAFARALEDAMCEKYDGELAMCPESAACSAIHYKSMSRIVGFNVRPDAVAADNAERDGVEIRTYRVIYDCIEEIEAAIKGMLAPKFRDVDIGRAEVRQVVRISSVGNIAGCHVMNGKITRNAKIRVVRDGIVVAEDEMASLRRFKDDVKEVASGFDCGIGLAKFNDIKEGDILEAFVVEEYRD